MLMQRTVGRCWPSRIVAPVMQPARLPACAASSGSSSGGKHPGRADGQVLLQTLHEASQEVPTTTLAFLQQSLQHYLARTPAVHDTVAALTSHGISSSSLAHDHYAYRTLGLPNLGIHSMAAVLQELGYTLEEEGLQFPAKKLTAAWFSRKQHTEAPGPGLPRIFVSEIKVDQLSSEAQSIIKRKAAELTLGPAAVTTACLTGTLPWPLITLEEYNTLLKESDYAAWVMVHGYALNHTALSVHSMHGQDGKRIANIKTAAGWMTAYGLPMNLDGGLIKVSPDGLLQQCSSMSDMVNLELEDRLGSNTIVQLPGSYLELVERLVLPEYAHLDPAHIKPGHRREGFEVSNASHLFTSTRKA